MSVAQNLIGSPMLWWYVPVVNDKRVTKKYFLLEKFPIAYWYVPV